MKKDEDIRARALSDQLREIDQRFEVAGGWSSSWRMRGGQFLSSVVLLVVVAQLGQDLIGPAIGLVLINVSIDPLIRLRMKRRAEEERARVVGLFEEIDRRAALVGEGETGEDS